METQTILTDKKQIRASVREQKKKLFLAEINERTGKILRNLYEMKEYQDAGRIYAYVNYNQEVNTSMLIKEALSSGKEVLVPRVMNEEMEFYRITSIKDLESGSYGILEPKEYAPADEIHSGFMILPGLAFDKNHHRIGYGGGFYDRYLEKYPIFYKVALCYDFQIFEEIESEEQDIPVDCVIYENGFF